MASHRMSLLNASVISESVGGYQLGANNGLVVLPIQVIKLNTLNDVTQLIAPELIPIIGFNFHEILVGPISNLICH